MWARRSSATRPSPQCSRSTQPRSRARQSQADEPRRPPRVASNSILAEAQRMARERLRESAATAVPSSPFSGSRREADGGAGSTGPARPSWRDEDECPAAAPGAAPAAKKPRHSPIVWAVHESGFREGQGPVPARPGARPAAEQRGAAAIAQAEIEAFQVQQKELLSLSQQEASGMGELVLKPSPSASSPEQGKSGERGVMCQAVDRHDSGGHRTLSGQQTGHPIPCMHR